MMNRLFLTILLVAFFGSMTMGQNFEVYDYINFDKYESSNEELRQSDSKSEVIFMGNSITEGWSAHSPEFMSSNGYINRGISGQTTDQMLLRFRKDVLDHQPKVVVILAGTNDLAQNSGPVPLWHTMNNIKSMAELAMANHVKVILCSVLPAKAFPWRPGVESIPMIQSLNQMISDFAKEKGMVYVDYYSAMQDGNGGLKVPEYTTAQDLVHPNAAGYEVMESLVKPAIDKALR
ncbi:MAG: GDSL-type esterase/lipase family protein [Cytophagales bacterium]|nr:GDSL-type esterase/lipase family protein [Cytophagales bacterium]